MTVLDELQATIAQVSQRASPSVVGVGRRIRGSGFVTEPGKVVTNAHNLRGDRVTIQFADGARQGDVTGMDADGDLAVISVDTGATPGLPWGRAEDVSIGRAVFGVAALPEGRSRVTVGLVSSVERAFRGPRGHRIAGSIEHTAPLAPGSSGGPLVDAEGRLVGINTNRIGDAFYLALPATEDLRARLASLGRGETVRRPMLGVAVAPSFVARRLRRSVGLPERDGVLVRGVEAGSPAARAGIQEGDLIVALGGRSVADADDLHDALAGTSLPVEVMLVRGTEERTVTVPAPEEPKDA
jgi:S1-C subfamily serine protease